MIISHYYKFIFIKPRKVAGTTIELSLSPFLEAGDLATSIEPEEEKLRVKKHGVIIGNIYKKNHLCLPSRLRDHSTLEKAYSLFRNSLDGYTVISACRNPWDRAVSNFFWAKRRTNIAQESKVVQKEQFIKFTRLYGPKTWMDHFYGRKRQRRLNSLHLYSKDNKCVVNFVIRFENLENDLLQLKKHFNFYSTPNSKSFKIKSYTRSPFSIKWQNLFDKDTENLVAECCSDEISLFNYDFEGKNQLNGPFIKNF